MVDGVYVSHAIGDDTADLFQARVRAHYRDCVSLHQDISLREQLKSFKRGPIRTEDTLAALDEALFVADQVADLDDIACGAVFEDFDGLRRGDGAREELYEVPSVEYGGWVVGFSRCAHGHGALDEIEGACYVVGGEGAGD